MKLMKRVFTLIGVMTLIAASMVTGNVAADEIGTTLTVETSVPACQDAIPSSVLLRHATRQFPAITPTNPPSSTIVRQNASTNIDFRVNACHEVMQWRVYVSISDFTSENGDTITSSGKVYVRGSRGVNDNQDFTQLTGYGLTSPVVVGNWESLMTVARGYVLYEGEPIMTSRGAETRSGGFQQTIQFGISHIPSNTPPGNYSANTIVTLSVGEP